MRKHKKKNEISNTVWYSIFVISFLCGAYLLRPSGILPEKPTAKVGECYQRIIKNENAERWENQDEVRIVVKILEIGHNKYLFQMIAPIISKRLDSDTFKYFHDYYNEKVECP